MGKIIELSEHVYDTITSMIYDGSLIEISWTKLGLEDSDNKFAYIYPPDNLIVVHTSLLLDIFTQNEALADSDHTIPLGEYEALLGDNHHVAKMIALAKNSGTVG